MSAPVPIIRAPGKATSRRSSAVASTPCKLLAEETGGAFFLFEDAMGHGKTTPLHRQSRRDDLRPGG
jgi:hypothetical protein